MLKPHKSPNCRELVGLWHPQLCCIVRLKGVWKRVRQKEESWEDKGWNLFQTILLDTFTELKVFT